MSKPLKWVVFVDGKTVEFRQRSTMRVFVAAQKAMGRKPIVKAIGF